MRLILGAGLLVCSAAVQAQSPSCRPPATFERPRPDRASADQPQRLLPIGGYTLALTWSPQFCRGRRDDAGFQCGGPTRFGFTLHGLWPDGEGREWPQYCRPTALLPDAVIRASICATPSAQLLQHEWAKHGTCMAGYRPASYFARSTALYAALRFPDMSALSRQPLKAGGLARELARLNPGLPANAVRVTTTRDGWLDELWLCLDRRLRYARCRPGSGGVTPGSDIQVWRGERQR